MRDASSSFVDSLLDAGHNLPGWLLALLAALFLGLPFLVAQIQNPGLDGMEAGGWRYLLLDPAVILYILLTAPWVRHSGAAVARGLRPILPLDEQAFARLVTEASQTRPLMEALAFVVGLTGGFMLMEPWRLQVDGRSLLWWFESVMQLLMFGFIGWFFYISFSSTRLTAALHRQPMNVDILNITPFEPVGRQSLLFVMIYFGGVTLSLLLLYSREGFFIWQNLVAYSVINLLAVLVFYWNMRPTHGVLTAAKSRELESTAEQLRFAYHRLQEASREGRPTAETAALFNAWTAAERRLKAAPTWPFDTDMIRTFAVTALTPLAIVLSRIISTLISEGRLGG